jgi:hypothetical protein
MPSITLEYGSSSGTTQAFTALSVKGFLPMDHQVMFPDLRPVYLDGSVRKKQMGFRRIFTIDLGFITDVSVLNFLGLFLNNEHQYISSFQYAAYGGTVTETDVRVVDRHSEFESIWEGGVEIGRHIILVLEEADIRVGYPTASGYGANYGGLYGTGL